MTYEEKIMRIARQAKLPACHTTHPKALARFADLVAGNNISSERVAETQEKQQIQDLLSLGGKIALELECLLIDTKDLAVVSRWWETGNEALHAWQDYLSEVR